MKNEAASGNLPSRPAELPHSTAGFRLIAVMALSALFALVATLSWKYGWFKWLLGAEFILAIAVYFALRALLNAALWSSME